MEKGEVTFINIFSSSTFKESFIPLFIFVFFSRFILVQKIAVSRYKYTSENSTIRTVD